MKIEKCRKGLSVWRSLLLGFIVLSVSFMLMMVFAGLFSFVGFNPTVFVNVVFPFVLALCVASVFVHFVYYNFDFDFLRVCVVCGAHQYSSDMNVLQDSETLEHVCYCKKHRFSNV